MYKVEFVFWGYSIENCIVLVDNPLENNVPIQTIFTKRIEKQRSLQEIDQIAHSRNSEMLVDLLKYADSKRFNIPMSQIGKRLL